MKRHILGKVFAATVILAASSYFTNLQGQEVKITFTNPTGNDYGNPDGIGGRISGERDPLITLQFNVGLAGQVALDASTISENQDNIDLVNSWDNDNVGNTSLQSIWGKSFTFILTSNKRLQCGKVSNGGADGIGCQGTNQRRIDQMGVELVYFILQGDVGIEFTAIEYRDINYSGGLANFEIWDHDTRRLDKVWYMEKIGDGIGSFDVTGWYNMRYKSDSLTVTTCDTTGENNPGGRLLSLAFNVVEPLPKPPAVLSTDPAHADTTVEITDDYVILFDSPMDQSTTSAAITFTPDVTNRVDAWNEAGDELTISFDDLSYFTEYTVKVGAGVKGTNGLNAEGDTTFIFKTLPEPPSVISTFPDNMAIDVPVNTPLSIEFSKPMIPDSVEKAISFNPELTILDYIWNGDNSTVYITTNPMQPEVLYFVTVGTVATDIYNIQLPEPYLFAYTTISVVSVDKSKAADIVVYPNPASDILQVSGMDVASLKVYSLSGQLVKAYYNTAIVNISDIETGIYVVAVTDKEDNKVRKMIVIE